MSMRSTASTVDSIEYIPSMTGEVFYIHHSLRVRHAGDRLEFYFIFLGEPRACHVQLIERAVTDVRRASPEVLTHDEMMDVFSRKVGLAALEPRTSPGSQSRFLEQEFRQAA